MSLAEIVVSEAAPVRTDGPRERTRRTDWDRARLGVVVPLCVVVSIAIVCIIVAALMSAHRANEVAIERETQLLSRAISNRAEWSLRRLVTLAQPGEAVRHLNIEAQQERIVRNLKIMPDHDMVVIVDASDQMSHASIEPNETRWINGHLSAIAPLVDFMRRRVPELPPGVIQLTRPSPAAADSTTMPLSFLQLFMGSLSIVTAVPMGPTVNDPTSLGGEASPIVFAVMIIDDGQLATFSSRLQLTDLREVSNGAVGMDEHLFTIADAHGNVITRLAWTPESPGKNILYSVVPFIGIALAGFAVLAGLVLRYMRHTAAAIKAGENRLRYLALHDPLSGLPNRNFFGERLETVITHVKQGGPPAALFYIDLDHFKDVNDTLGHPVGDELIRAVTLRLAHTLRGEDLVARLGGDEFAVITTVPSDQAILEKIGERFIQTVCAPYSIHGHNIVIGASIGVAVIGADAGRVADIMRYADMALYRAKNEGRNRTCIYDAVMDADLSQRKIIEQDLREAIGKDALDVVYQPIVNASGDKLVGVEALARWAHPTRGNIPPSEFIPIAEHSGLIAALGANVLRRACLAAKTWPTLTVSVNVSPLQFRQVDFVATVERILAETGIDPSQLELELTESTLLGNVESAEAAMRKIKTLGVRLALDDFGTGYSSLHYLRRFPFDRLKIDRSFVLSIEHTADAAAIVHAIVSLGRGLGMKVTAEGVETAEQHLFLRAAGVQCMQGYRFGMPCKADEIARRVANPGVYRSIEGDAAAALAS